MNRPAEPSGQAGPIKCADNRRLPALELTDRGVGGSDC